MNLNDKTAFENSQIDDVSCPLKNSKFVHNLSQHHKIYNHYPLYYQQFLRNQQEVKLVFPCRIVCCTTYKFQLIATIQLPHHVFQITYKIAPSNNPPTPTVIEQPVIKLDYSNLKLPMATTVDQSKQPASVPSSSARHLQPTIKIDLSNISSFRNTPTQVQSAPVALMAGSGKPQQHQQVPSTPTTASTPSTPLSALSSASSSGSSICGGSSITSSKNPYVFQQQSVASTSTGSGSAAPLYSSVSSAIPGMDEDYDDI